MLVTILLTLFKTFQYLLSGNEMRGTKHKKSMDVIAVRLSSFGTGQEVTRMAWTEESSLVYAATQHEVSEFTYDHKCTP